MNLYCEVKEVLDDDKYGKRELTKKEMTDRITEIVDDHDQFLTHVQEMKKAVLEAIVNREDYAYFDIEATESHKDFIRLIKTIYPENQKRKSVLVHEGTIHEAEVFTLEVPVCCLNRDDLDALLELIYS